MYADLDAVTRDVAAIVRPPERLSVPAAAERYVKTETGAWSNALTYYMVEPAECLTSREYGGVIVAAPARTGKTQSFMDNWVAHTVMCDPTHMLLIFPTAALAQRFSEERIDKMHRHSPEIRAMLSNDQNADNIFRKKYTHGMNVNLISPTKNSLAGLEYARVCLVDLDRFDDDIGGDGDAYTLGSKRTQTFLSRGTTAAESSPSKPILDAKWSVSKERPHEAPPCGGILRMFNQGDRRRLYTRCQHCGEFWMPAPDFRAFHIPAAEPGFDISERAALAGVTCTTCGAVNGPEHERAVKRGGVWVAEGQTIDSNARLHGKRMRREIASFWFPGVFAAFQSWREIVAKYLTALEDFERTGDELALKSTINVDQGAPYLPRSKQGMRTAEELRERTDTALERATVPAGVRFMVASVDVQKSKFVVQVMGVGVDQQRWIIDRFDLSGSPRVDDDGRPVGCDPASHIEDWAQLLPEVIARTYPLSDGSGRRMQIARTACDMHGEPGVTDHAYDFARSMARGAKGRRLRLVRGGNVQKAPRVTPREHDDGLSAKVGYLELNTGRLKDMVHGAIGRTEPGPGYTHLPAWLPEDWFDELLAEVKDDRGRWQKVARRNEALDLMVYGLAAAIDLKVDAYDWQNPPSHAREWDRNPLVNDAPGTKTESASEQAGATPAPGARARRPAAPKKRATNFIKRRGR